MTLKPPLPPALPAVAVLAAALGFAAAAHGQTAPDAGVERNAEREADPDALPDLDPDPTPGIEALPDPGVPTAPPAQPQAGAMPERGMEVDGLLAALSVAGEDEWRPLQQKIMALWARDESAAMTLLLTRATRAMEAGDTEEALAFLDDLVRLAPDFAEGWNRRATLHFQLENYGRSVADIQRVLALEPRHFGAMAGLGIILDRLERDAEALSVFRRALEIHPHLEGAREAVERLQPLVEGREL